MLGRWSNIVALPSALVPWFACGGLFMNNYRASHWSKWSGRKVKRAVEIFPCGYAWVEGSLAQEAESEFRLVQEFVPYVLGKGGINTKNNGK